MKKYIICVFIFISLFTVSASAAVVYSGVGQDYFSGLDIGQFNGKVIVWGRTTSSGTLSGSSNSFSLDSGNGDILFSVSGKPYVDYVDMSFVNSNYFFESGRTYVLYFEIPIDSGQTNRIFPALFNRSTNRSLSLKGYDLLDKLITIQDYSSSVSSVYNYSNRTMRFNLSFTPTVDIAGDIFLRLSFSSPVGLDSLGWSYDSHQYILKNPVIRRSSGSNSVDVYINQAASEIVNAVNDLNLNFSAMGNALQDILSYMTGDQEAILNSTYDELYAIHYLLSNNMIPAIVNGFASLEGAVKLGFADTALEIQAQTSQLILTLTNCFESLEIKIGQESDDIQSAIQAQTNAILAYLENAFSQSNSGAMLDSIGDLENTYAPAGAVEDEVMSSIDNYLPDIGYDTFSVPVGVLSAMTWTVGKFNVIWDELGADLQFLIMLPLMIGLVLLLIGRGSMSYIMSGLMRHRRKGDS